MHNFPYSQNPKTWEEYQGHPRAKRLFQGYATRGARALPRALFISGSSGTGKTSLVRLLIRSFRCQERVGGNPCGRCAACTDLDERIADRSLTDVYWIQPGGFNDEDSLRAQVKQALAAAARGQRRTKDATHDVLFVVFDEWQTFPINIRQEVLIRAEVEVPGNNVCYIFVTMQEERLGEEDRTALIRRSTFVKLLPFSKDHLKSFLVNKFPDLLPEVASMIASKSRGSPGLALAYYDNIKQDDPLLSVDSASYILSYANNDQRWALWRALETNARYPQIKELVDFILERVEPLELSRQLTEDILRSATIITNDHKHACLVLNQFRTNYRNADITSYLIMLLGMSLVTEAGVYELNQQPPSYTSL